MRAFGITETFITGDASDQEKFQKWAETVPYTLRNPLYHWTHLELQRYFNITELLRAETANRIYTYANEALSTPEFSTQKLLTKMNVEVVCTTDDPSDSLQSHKQLANSGFTTKVLPTFRPDKVYNFSSTDGYISYLNTLSLASGIEITSYDSLLLSLQNRIKHFHETGCRLADHGLEQINIPAQVYNPQTLFTKLLGHEVLSGSEQISFRYSILIELCKMYHKQGWVQQFHLGALRNTNTRMMHLLGADSGFDTIGDFSQASSLARFLSLFFGQVPERVRPNKSIVQNHNL